MIVRSITLLRLLFLVLCLFVVQTEGQHDYTDNDVTIETVPKLRSSVTTELSDISTRERLKLRSVMEQSHVRFSCRWTDTPRQSPYCPNCKKGDIDIMISSYGGVGTTHIFDRLENLGYSLNIRNDLDFLKHTVHPPLVSFNPFHPDRRVPFRAIYVYDDPRHATMSLFRRRYHGVQIGKNNGRCKIPSPVKEAWYKSDEKNPTVVSYIRGGLDLFQFKRNFYNYWSDPVPYERIFVRGSVADAYIDVLLNVLRSDQPIHTLRGDDKITFPTITYSQIQRYNEEKEKTMGWKNRQPEHVGGKQSFTKTVQGKRVVVGVPHKSHRDWHDLPTELKDDMENTYGDFNLVLDSLPPIVVIPGTSTTIS
eukprot:TRINITY_DN9553_c0_g1_i1.p1 TRINITY_DN9553_c0_g1~~TRINITY_DN9553_c0_g1_i1.p1  ORF type:complete len:365 (+),score=79.82 TRINITY_DN9553_c0_g1_i1:190-1284(+)